MRSYGIYLRVVTCSFVGHQLHCCYPYNPPFQECIGELEEECIEELAAIARVAKAATVTRVGAILLPIRLVVMHAQTNIRIAVGVRYFGGTNTKMLPAASIC